MRKSKGTGKVDERSVSSRLYQLTSGVHVRLNTTVKLAPESWINGGGERVERRVIRYLLKEGTLEPKKSVFIVIEIARGERIISSTERKRMEKVSVSKRAGKSKGPRLHPIKEKMICVEPR